MAAICCVLFFAVYYPTDGQGLSSLSSDEEFARAVRLGKLDDSEKTLKLELDKCNYETVFKPVNGNVTLMLDHHSVTECFVRLTYADRLNSATVRLRAIDDL